MSATLPAPTTRTRWRAVGVLLVALTLGLTTLTQQQLVHAQAALAAPANLTPDAISVDGVPVLTWDPVPGATTYTVELYGGPGMTRQWVVTTVNRRYVPVKHLPAGALTWRVKATAGTQTSPWADAAFDRDPLAGPTLVSPASGAVLDQPEEPVLVSWSPVRGATEYTIQVSTDASFTDTSLITTLTASATATVIPDMQVAQTYHWRVRAELSSDLLTSWSEVRDYEIGGLDKAVLVSPPDSPTSDVEDIVLTWDPVPGARSYNLQVSTDQNFPPGNLDVDLFGNKSVMGTSYSPPVTLANDQYYWRVQPVDNSGNLLDWSQTDTWTFRRHWPDQPQLDYPVGNAIVGDPIYYQWQPVHLASAYEIQLATDSAFSNIVDSCPTVHTTYTPMNKADCYPTDLGTYYWRVVAYDDPGKTRDRARIRTDVLSAEVGQFTYVGAGATLSSPVNGALGVEVPTLRWQPVPGAEKYKVTVTRVDTGDTLGSNIFTSSTSYTPRELLTPGVQYRWDVVPVSMSGRIGASLLPAAQPRFTMAATPATPTASAPEPTGPAPGSAHQRFPTLTWTPVVDAVTYKVLVRKQGTLGWTTLKSGFYYPAGEDEAAGLKVGSVLDTNLDAGTYEWYVEAYNEAGGFLSSSSATSTYTIAPVASAGGLRVSLTGSAADETGKFCDTALPALCADLRQTPVLSWDGNDNLAGYAITIARDAEMTNVVAGYPKTVENTRYVPIDALVDSQAGSAFFWTVTGMKTTNVKGAGGHAEHAFNKLSKPVQTISPAAEDTQANDITFTWRDYLETNQDTGAFPAGGDANSVSPRIEAMQYEIQVSADANFQTLAENARVVDQTTYTSFDNTYTEGPLYWRVRAIDGSGNRLAWSTPVKFYKNSPTVTLTEPINGEHVSGSAPLRWTPIPFAAEYEVQVYKNGDTTGSPANLVDSGKTKQPAIGWIDPMEASATFYSWRVRPIDVDKHLGRWTDLADPAARFYVTGTAPQILDPAPDVYLPKDDTLFTWDAVDDAASYKFERRRAGAATASETVNTVALGWAPRTAVPDGEWEWRVASLDAKGKVLAWSSWRTFFVDATNPTVTLVKPTGKVKRGANFYATFSEPVSNVTGKTYFIKVAGTTKKLAATVTMNATGTRAKLNPTANLKSGKRYLLTLKSTIKDANGNPLVAKSWTVTAK